MKRLKKILFLALMVTALSCLFCQPAFAISEEEVQAQVDAVGKEAVSGNVLIWFMCAIGFLKVSQKIDSFMASLGVNVGHTGGSMLAEAMIAARGFSGFKSFASNHFAGGRSSHSSHVNASGGGKGGAGFGAGFASGGLAGVIKRNVTNNAVKTATTPPDAKPSGLSGLVGGAAGGIGGHIYASSVSKGGNFANNVIGSVATGSITQMGTMTGDKAVDALHSYMGHAALEPGAENIPTYQNVEIGGGRITGTEVTPEHPEGIAFGMYHADQYVAPEGQYTTVHAVDGTAWYKQYAADAVEKSPYMAPDGSIAYRVEQVHGLVLGDSMDLAYQILTSTGGAKHDYFMLDGSYDHFYFLTNDHQGEVILALLCDPVKTAELDRILSQGLSAGNPGSAMEQDAAEPDGTPVLFGYFCDLPRIVRFNTALELMERPGTLICFDFQADVLRHYCGDRVHLQTIDFTKFEGRLFP